MPVQVIRVYVQAHGGERTHRARRVQLEAGKLNREHLGVGVDRARDRRTDVAHLFGFDARSAQDLPEHTDGRGLAVRSGHRQPRAPRVGTLLLEAPGELHLAPQVNARLLARSKDRVMRGDPRRDNDEVGAGIAHRGRQGVRVLLDVDGHARDVVEGKRGGGPRRVGANTPVAGKQGARGSLAGLTPADDGSAAVHRAYTHSA